MLARIRILGIVLILAATSLTTAARAQTARLDIPFTITKPAGTGPFPAVVLLHDCSGLGPRSSGAPWRWSSEFTRWGFVTIWPDSFATRGHPDGVCREPARGNVVPRARVADALAAAAHLRTLGFVDPERIAVMGGSHGGTSAMAAVDASRETTAPGRFAAAVALYPGCKYFTADRADPAVTHVYQTRAPTLILIGSLDDWTPAPPCERLVAASKSAGQPIEIEVYAGAHHSFDSAAPVRFDASRINSSAPGGRGATTGGNAAAWEKARLAVHAFLVQKLGKGPP